MRSLRSRNKSVPGIGDARAQWLFVGEAPGADEDAKGEPFVGQAGRLLDNMLAALGLARGRDVYIANVLKCRPPNNRTPTPLEVDACRPTSIDRLSSSRRRSSSRSEKALPRRSSTSTRRSQVCAAASIVIAACRSS
jgi:uracil-DNA glycosylase family 4